MNVQQYQSPPTVTGQSQEANVTGIVGFVVSLLGIVTCGLISPVALLINGIGLMMKPRGFAIAGTVLSLIGTAFLATIGYGIVASVLFVKEAAQELGHSLETVASLEEGRQEIESYRSENGSYPDAVKGNELVMDIEDGWDRSILYGVEDDGSFVLRSSGEDGEFHTDDDITSTHTQQGVWETNIDTEGIDFGEGGITIRGGDDIVEFGPDGINVNDGESKVNVGPSGVHVEDGNSTVDVNPGGVRVSE